ncbi:MAG: manganese efflux pump [Polyangiaceae bacterium]
MLRRMWFAPVLLLAVGLAMDAAAAAASRGLAAPEVRFRDTALIGLLFGGAQAGMPVLGALAGERMGAFAAQWGDWIAAAVFFALGLKALVDLRSKKNEEQGEGASGDADEKIPRPFALPTLVLLALATSIDALVAGVTLPMMHAPLGAACATIGATTAILSVAALLLGRRLGRAFEGKLDIVGGVVLLGLGVKMIVGHFLG